MLSLIIPCYNEESTLKNCVESCLLLKNHNIDLELIIVDDCSTDNSLEIAHQLQKDHEEIVILQNKVNLGKGASVQQGFKVAHGEYVGIQDADMEYDPLDYLELLKPIEENKADVVYGSRYLRSETRKVHYFWHTWMNKTLTFISNMFSNFDLSDMAACYKLFRRDVVEKITPMLKENRFSFDAEVTTIISRLNVRVFECTIHYSPRTYEEGKKIGWKDGVRALYCLFYYGSPYAALPMQLIIYFFINLISAIANFTLYSICLYCNYSILFSVLLSFIVGFVVNQSLTVFSLFKDKKEWKNFHLYYIFIIIACMFDLGITTLLINAGFSAINSRIISIVIGFIANFALRRYQIF